MNLSSYIKNEKKCRMFYSFRLVKLSLINLPEIFSQNKVSLYAIIRGYFIFLTKTYYDPQLACVPERYIF